jgi:hypothetical protein
MWRKACKFPACECMLLPAIQNICFIRVVGYLQSCFVHQKSTAGQLLFFLYMGDYNFDLNLYKYWKFKPRNIPSRRMCPCIVGLFGTVQTAGTMGNLHTSKRQPKLCAKYTCLRSHCQQNALHCCLV